jgi:hypothetical protein
VGSKPSSFALPAFCTGGLIERDEGAPLREDKAARRTAKEAVDGSARVGDCRVVSEANVSFSIEWPDNVCLGRGRFCLDWRG